MYCLYTHIRKSDNIIFYIGIGNDKRPYIKGTRSGFWKNEVKKHDYNIEILTNNLTWENAQEAEIQLIKLYGRRDLGLGDLVNMADGGDGSPGTIVSNETKKKLSISMKGKNSGSKNGMYGLKGDLDFRKLNPRKGKDNHFYNSEINKGGNNPNAKKVINIQTKEIWDCASNCAEQNNIKKSTLIAWLSGQNKNKSDFRYL